MATKRICVIGAGPSGLTSIKQCLEEGLEVVCYEKTDSIGGLWHYRDDDVDGLPSVAKSTIINSSKEMSAFSDFPPPANFPNFMEHKLMLEYFHRYAKHNDLLKHIRFLHQVVEVTFNDDYQETGRWRVKVQDESTHNITENVFDGVMACSGHHIVPISPYLPGQSEFKGRLLHSHSYKKPVDMNDKVAIVLGIGNSGLDVAVELSRVCSQVYLSTRRGAWIMHRVGLKGAPADFLLSRRICRVFFDFLPFRLSNWIAETLLNQYFNHERYGIKPKHRFFSQHVTLNDSIANCILSGRVRIRPNIERFTEDGVLFAGEEKATKCDVVVFATGYEISLPYLNHSIMPVLNNHVQLYKNVFRPTLLHPHTLAVVGLVQPIGAVFPISEIQARWFVQIMKGNVQLPKMDEMQRQIEKDMDKMKKRYYESVRHTIQVDYMDYMDSISTLIGAKPNLWRYFFTDLRLWFSMFFGPCVPYQYRLQGPNTWLDARAAILNAVPRTYEALKS